MEVSPVDLAVAFTILFLCQRSQKQIVFSLPFPLPVLRTDDGHSQICRLEQRGGGSLTTYDDQRERKINRTWTMFFNSIQRCETAYGTWLSVVEYRSWFKNRSPFELSTRDPCKVRKALAIPLQILVVAHKWQRNLVLFRKKKIFGSLNRKVDTENYRLLTFPSGPILFVDTMK